jgi:hypothetical protein
MNATPLYQPTIELHMLRECYACSKCDYGHSLSEDTYVAVVNGTPTHNAIDYLCETAADVVQEFVDGGCSYMSSYERKFSSCCLRSQRETRRVFTHALSITLPHDTVLANVGPPYGDLVRCAAAYAGVPGAPPPPPGPAPRAKWTMYKGHALCIKVTLISYAQARSACCIGDGPRVPLVDYTLVPTPPQ